MKTLIVAAMFGSAIVAVDAADVPEVKVSAVRKVFDDGHHDAFTDLVVFKGAFYLAFRSCPDGHGVSPNASIIVLTSKDTREWQQVHAFQVAQRDTRAPHFLAFKDRLFVYTGTWFSGDSPARSSEDLDLNLHLGFGTWIEDGSAWSEPALLEGTFGHSTWRAASAGGTAYLCGRRKVGFEVGPKSEPNEVESLMLEGDDGLIWRRCATFQEIAGDETAFLFDRHGAVTGIARRGRGTAQLLRSAPPYQQWQRHDLDRYIGGPLLARWGGRTVVGGRHSADGGATTSLCWLVGDQLHEFAALPSGGDNSYPGFVAITPTKAVVSWYSSHEGSASIYLAELEISTDDAGFGAEQRESIRLADHLLSFQREDGGWPKGIDLRKPLDAAGELQNLFARRQRDSTLDNGATHSQIRQLAKAFTLTGIPRFRHGCEAGLEFLLDAQLPNGGWPQRYPVPENYARHITFNDGAMVGALAVLHAVGRGEAPFVWVDAGLRERAASAVSRGVDCILKCQVVTAGVPTAWGQQHDGIDFLPRAARRFEPAGLCSAESVGIVEFLMRLESPQPEVVRAIEAAVAWLDGPAKLSGIRQLDGAAGGKRIVADPDAPPLWARLYEIGSNRPIFGDRDGKIYFDLPELSDERREGYSWYGRAPAKLLETTFPAWKRQLGDR